MTRLEKLVIGATFFAMLVLAGFVAHDVLNRDAPGNMFNPWPGITVIEVPQEARPFHNIGEFKEWKPDNSGDYIFLAPDGSYGDCDDAALGWTRLALRNGFIISPQWVDRDGLLGGVYVLPGVSPVPHLGILVVTDRNIWYWDYEIDRIFYIAPRD